MLEKKPDMVLGLKLRRLLWTPKLSEGEPSQFLEWSSTTKRVFKMSRGFGVESATTPTHASELTSTTFFREILDLARPRLWNG